MGEASEGGFITSGLLQKGKLVFAFLCHLVVIRLFLTLLNL